MDVSAVPSSIDLLVRLSLDRRPHAFFQLLGIMSFSLTCAHAGGNGASGWLR